MTDNETREQMANMNSNIEALLKAQIAFQDNPSNAKAALTISRLHRDTNRKLDKLQISVDDNSSKTEQLEKTLEPIAKVYDDVTGFKRVGFFLLSTLALVGSTIAFFIKK